MERFKPDRKQSNRMLGKIRAFNNKIKREGLSDEYLLNYREIMGRDGNKGGVYSKRGYEQVINRINRFLRKGAERKIRTKAGVEITVWERNEFIYAQRAANKNKKKIWSEERFRPGIKYEPFTRRAGEVKTKKEFENILKAYMKMGSVDYLSYRESLLRENLMRSVEWMDVYPGLYKRMVSIIQNTERDVLVSAVNDEMAPTTVNFNYPVKGIEPVDAYEFAKMVVEGWEHEIKKLKEVV